MSDSSASQQPPGPRQLPLLAPAAKRDPDRQPSDLADDPPTRRKIGRACVLCRRKKIRCDGASPTCNRCVESNDHCSYGGLDRRRLDSRQKELRALQSKLRRLQYVTDTLLSVSDDDAIELLRVLRDAPGSPGSSTGLVVERLRELRGGGDIIATLPPAVDDEPSPASLEETSVAVVDAMPDSAAAAVLPDSLPPHKSLSQPRELTSRDDLPPESDIRAGAAAFLANTAALFYFISTEELDALLDRIYRPRRGQTATIDTLDLCDICSLAALGYQYVPRQPSESYKYSLFLTATMHVNECIKTDSVRVLRVITSLAAYDIVAHRTSAHVSIVSGLNLAHNLLAIPLGTKRDLFMKLYRTLIFMECWLSTTLGYPPELGTADREFVNPSAPPFSRLDDDTFVQEQAGIVGFLRAEILMDAPAPLVSTSTAERHIEKLANWYLTLPDEMQLDALLSPAPSSLPESQRRGLLFVHVLHLGAVILAHRQAIASAASVRLQNPLSVPQEEGILANDSRPVTAARQIARIFRLVDYEKNVFRRCWLSISEIYSACTVLLFITSYDILTFSRDRLQEDLSMAGSLLDMLSCASSVDTVAKKFVDILRPVHRALSFASDVTNVSPPPWFIFTKFRDVLQETTELVGNAFGHPRRRDIGGLPTLDEGTPTWWD